MTSTNQQQNNKKSMNIDWDVEKYKDTFSFIPGYGKEVISLINAKKGSKVLDIGCGNGTLTKFIEDAGFIVTGIDESEEMIKKAQEDYPEIKFYVKNAINFKMDEKYDVVFSNAVFHWIEKKYHSEMLKSIYEVLTDNGELVFEIGGNGCCEKVHSTLEKVFKKYNLVYPRTFYFPSVGEYTSMLEENGFLVRYAIHFDRPTPRNGPNGLKEWILTIDKKPFENIDNTLTNKIVDEAVEILRPELFKNNQWIIDFVRLRIRAVKK